MDRALWLLTALNLWVKGWFISYILHLFQMIETNDISEEKIKMKETMEGMKLLFLPCSTDLYSFSSSNFLVLQGWLHGRSLGSNFICQNLLDDICCLALFVFFFFILIKLSICRGGCFYLC